MIVGLQFNSDYNHTVCIMKFYDAGQRFQTFGHSSKVKTQIQRNSTNNNEMELNGRKIPAYLCIFKYK